MKKNYLQQPNKGFTIIETLVAVTILMIAMVGPLTIAHRGLLAANFASQQVTASYLAQDGIEFVKNVKDNNRLRIENGEAIDWLFALSGCNETSPCKIETSGNPSTPASAILPCISDCRLYNSASAGYTHDTSATPTPYSRYFYLVIPQQSSANEAKMVMMVTWSNGTIDNVFAFENEIFNIHR